MAGFDSQTIAVVLGIYLLGGLVKGVLGFGLPIITMSLLPFVISVEKAIVLSALVQPATNIFQLVSTGGYRRSIELAWPVLLSLLPGIVLGAWFLTSLEPGLVVLIVGITISLYALYDLSGFGIRISRERAVPAGIGFGLIAGIFGALTSVNGWAFIMYLLGLGTDRNEFRSAIALLFLVSGLMISGSFWAVGLLTTGLLVVGVTALVPSFLGMWLGNLLGEAIPGQQFRKLLLCALVIIGLVLAWRGYGSIFHV